jgi:formylglycine-generating enzyme required for sulfatase activity
MAVETVSVGLTMLGFLPSLLSSFTHDKIKRLAEGLEREPLKKLFIRAFKKSLDHHYKKSGDMLKELKAAVKRNPDRLVEIFEANTGNLHDFLADSTSGDFRKKTARLIMAEFLPPPHKSEHPQVLELLVQDCLDYYQISFLKTMSDREALQTILRQTLKLDEVLDIVKKIESDIRSKIASKQEVREIKELIQALFKKLEQMEKAESEDKRTVGRTFSKISDRGDHSNEEFVDNQRIIEGAKNRMIQIPGDTFLMGDEKNGQFDVNLDSFLIDVYPVTQVLYRLVTGKNPSALKGDDKPVESLSWLDAVEFCNQLSEKNNLYPVYEIIDEKNVRWIDRKDGFRLPTEAEWEYSCRARTSGDLYGPIDDIAWYRHNSKATTQDVGLKKPNDFGLYDMIGNVWEWVWDWHGPYPSEPKVNPKGPDKGSRRVIRGCCWNDFSDDCHSTFRQYGGPTGSHYITGFRVARSLPK